MSDAPHSPADIPDIIFTPAQGSPATENHFKSDKSKPAKRSWLQLGKKGKMLLGSLAIAVLLSLAIVGWAGYLYYQAVYTPDQPSGNPISITIPDNATTEQISQQLVDQGLLQNPTIFKIYLRLNPQSTIQAGDFTIPQHISIKDLAARLGIASRDQAILVFPEGWRREEIAEYLQTEHQQGKISFTGEQFSNLALHPTAEMRQKLGSRLPANASLQGFLFPDTYYLDQQATATDLINKMLDNYLKKVTPALQSGITKQGLTEYQALILAAIVERESFSGDERPIIGQILLKRLRQGEILGTDATLQYALGYSKTEKRWWRQIITAADLSLDSPYNTRLHPGLPPAPIANPGLEAIQAIAQPQSTPYLYYLHDSQGRVHYAKTLAEHNANVAKYLQ